MIIIAIVIFWQSVFVAVYKPTLTLYPQQAHLFLAVIASFSIFLLRFHRNFFNFLNLLFSRWEHWRRLHFRLFDLRFFFFVILIFSRLDGRVLETTGAEAIKVLGGVEGFATLAHGLFGFLN